MASIDNNNLDIDTALTIWRLDDGYRNINSYLADADYKFHRKGSDTVIFNDVKYSTREIIDVIVENMKLPGNDEFITYYRGGSTNSRKNFFKTNFISVSDDEEEAAGFVDGDCCLYEVTVAPDVKRIRTGIEYETILEPGLYWEYLDKKKITILQRYLKVHHQKRRHLKNRHLMNQHIKNYRLENQYRQLA